MSLGKLLRPGTEDILRPGNDEKSAGPRCSVNPERNDGDDGGENCHGIWAMTSVIGHQMLKTISLMIENISGEKHEK